MRQTTKNLLICAVIFLAIAIPIGIMRYFALQPNYASNDPLYGTFAIEPLKIYPSEDFFISIDVDIETEPFSQYAEESSVDISTGCWVYSYSEKKIFRALKDGKDKLDVYENGEKIGWFKYTYKSFLGIHFDEKYACKWRENEFILQRKMPAVVFPQEY